MAAPETELKRDRSAWQFSVRSLVLTTALVSWILAVNRWLGAPFGWITAIPLGLIAIVGLATRGRALGGFGVGSAPAALLAYWFLIEWDPSDIRFFKSLAAVGAYGGAAGGGLHAFWLGKRWLGALTVIAALAIFGLLLVIPISA